MAQFSHFESLRYSEHHKNSRQHERGHVPASLIQRSRQNFGATSRKRQVSTGPDAQQHKHVKSAYLTTVTPTSPLIRATNGRPRSRPLCGALRRPQPHPRIYHGIPPARESHGAARCSLLRTARHGTARDTDARAAPQQPPPSEGGTSHGSGHGRAPAATEPRSRAVPAGLRAGHGGGGCRGPSVQLPCPPPASPRIPAAPCPPYRGGAGGPRARLGHGGRRGCRRGAIGGGAKGRTLPSRAASPSSSCRAGGAGAGRPSSLLQRRSGLRCVAVVKVWGGRGKCRHFPTFKWSY